MGVDALVTVCSRNTNVITLLLLGMGHGGRSKRILSEHKRHYGEGMDALVTVCFRNTNVIVL